MARPSVKSKDQRRRDNRAARRAEHSPSVTDEQSLGEATDSLVAAASGSTSLPLSDRDTPWDAGAAVKTLAVGQYADAHFWRDPKGDPKTLAAYKLPFATNDGGLTAVWKGVTAGAAAVQGARGGVDIPEADVPGVRAKMEAFYAKARTAYKDPSIKAPWLADKASEDAETAAVSPERQALAAVEAALASESEAEAEAFAAMAPCAACDHAYADHLGATGPCTADGCDCSSYEPAATGETAIEIEEGEPIVEILAENGSGTFTLTFTKQDGTDLTLATANMDDMTGAELLAFHADPNAVIRGLFAAPITEVALPPEHQPGAALPEQHPSPAAPDLPATGSAKRWTATLAPEGVQTDDGRMFAPGSITWRDLPLTLMAQLETAEGHDGAVVAGRIDRIWREGALILGEGVFDDGEVGSEIARLVDERVLRGISVDIAIRAYEVAYKSDLEATGEAPAEVEEPGLVDLLFGGDDVVFVVTDGVIGAVTVCSFPAFAEAQIALTASAAIWRYTAQSGIIVTAKPCEALTASLALADGLPAVVTASAAGYAPVSPPSAWFADPELSELTPLVVTAEGHLYGHAAAWEFEDGPACHIGYPDVCIVPPHSNSGNAYFHLGEIECEDGERFSSGKITLGTGHADPKLGYRGAVEHYDHTGTVVADVVSGEDEFGIWVAGALRPDVDAAKVRELRAAVLSGDWRSVNGNLELVAMLAVNVPGFPVPRTRALVAAGEDGQRVLALTAAGTHDGHHLLAQFSEDELAQIRALGVVASDSLTGEFEALAVRARGESA